MTKRKNKKREKIVASLDKGNVSKKQRVTVSIKSKNFSKEKNSSNNSNSSSSLKMISNTPIKKKDIKKLI